MNKITLLALALSTLLGIVVRFSLQAGLAMPAASARAQSSGPKVITTRSPFYCNLGVLSPTERKRIVELVRLVRASKQNYREIEDGVEMRFPADAKSIQTVAEWITLEHLCCPFFDFDLHLQRDNGTFVFRLTGREGVKQFIHSEFHFTPDHPVAALGQPVKRMR